ncbi:two component transcriptional regulator, winged helix family [Paenibacillus curdlanolyticus YK9]|uniref:Two component transcriptional regulator, winged helix family n=1 Tax=Paenibacillus curdlanolyticus YK9 TaxID=717606 RepID=E0IF27_9BACL|nr:response regulator transcription factor [Paenibacillus curdlanolyticus]EFM08803.1 two component transcriptional regulator, winged helix family [Paenibacillus curdlanolyticus YK9]
MSEWRTILVVDDDPSIVELLRDFLEYESFQVLTACDAAQALALFQQHPVHGIVLDVMMPGQNGFELCRTIRSSSSVPILFLSARGEDVDKIRGLTLGGDDYIVKTASPGEIVARVKAVLRRSSAQQEQERSLAVLDYDEGRLQINLSTREVFVDGTSISLTPREFELLQLFVERPRQVFSYDHLIDKLWEGVGDKHTVRVHLSRLRDKIESDPAQPRYLINVWGVGYRFEGGLT